MRRHARRERRRGCAGAGAALGLRSRTGPAMAKRRQRRAGSNAGQSAGQPQANLSPPVAPQPENMRPQPRGLPKPSPLNLDDDTASEDSFTTASSVEQQLRRRPSPVSVPGSGDGAGLVGRLLTGYSHGSSSFPPAGESGAVSADGRPVRGPSGAALKAKGGSPRSTALGSPKSGSDSSPRAGKRRDFQPLDLTTARKIDLMQSEKSVMLEKTSSSARARQQSAGTCSSVHTQAPRRFLTLGLLCDQDLEPGCCIASGPLRDQRHVGLCLVS